MLIEGEYDGGESGVSKIEIPEEFIKQYAEKRREKIMEKTFEQFLTENVEKGFIDFRIRAEMQDQYTVRFYIHVLGHDSETLDFTVDENTLTQI